MVSLSIVTAGGCKPVNENEILIDGSTTMFELSKTWANAFMKENPGIKVEVSKSGTGKGIEAFIRGKVDIAETSRRLTAEELSHAQKNNVRVQEYYVGFAIYCIVVNPENPISQLKEEQVKDIFLGKISNWKDVGGKDMQIDVLWREIPPHEYDFFLEKYVDISDNIGLSKPPSSIMILPAPKDIVAEVARNERAIGYLFIQDVTPGVKSLAIAKQGTEKYTKPTVADASNGAYHILRPYYMYADRNYQKPVKQFIHFIYSPEGLIIAKGMNFVPVPTKEGEVDRDVLFEFI